jgi:hypothetical protein
MAMLSGEKNVCLASEAIVFSERVSANACVIAETADMTPGVELAAVKVMYADGILGGGDCFASWKYLQLETWGHFLCISRDTDSRTVDEALRHFGRTSPIFAEIPPENIGGQLQIGRWSGETGIYCFYVMGDEIV